ncbi:hypothetical protein KR009_003979, partial [Drosophila setifemur]
MQLDDFIKYLDLSLWMGMVPRYQWAGRTKEIGSYRLARKMFFIFCACGITYQTIGVIIYFELIGRKGEDTSEIVAEISEMTGTLMLLALGVSNIWALTHFRPDIEEVLSELNELLPRPGEVHHRIEHYYKISTGMMKFKFIFYQIFYVYYNGAPLAALLFEKLMEGHEWSYKTQTNSWYPWKVQGSAIGFSAVFICQAMFSIVGVGFTTATQLVVCLFAFQLNLHFDTLSNRLTALDSRHPNANQDLKQLIAYHSRILQIAERCNSFLNFIFLSSLICSTTAICMTSVAVLLLDLTYAFRYISGLTAFVIYHFVICYLGTEVTWEGKTESTTRFIVEMTEMTSALMLMVVGAFNIWALTYLRPDIEEVLTEFNELFPRPRERYFRVEHYYM